MSRKMALSMKKTINSGSVNERDRPATPRKVNRATRKHPNVTAIVDALKNYAGCKQKASVPKWTFSSHPRPTGIRRIR